jgi:cytochrome P450
MSRRATWILTYVAQPRHFTDLTVIKVYGPTAAEFNPSRFLDEKGQLKPAPPDTKDEGHIAFGFGRRICVGRYVANDALFVAMATILWALDVQNAGGEIDVDAHVDQGMTMWVIPSR